MTLGTLLSVSVLTISVTLSAAAPQNGAQIRPAIDPKDTAPWPSAPALAAAKREAERRPLFATADPLVFSLVADFGKVQGEASRPPTCTGRSDSRR